MILIKVILLILLILIFIQDMRFRAVSWVLFPMITLLFFLINSNESKLTSVSFNLLFLAAQIFFLWLYFSLKHRKPVNIFSQYIGLGDVLFLCAITFYFSPINFLFFYISSLILIILYVLIQKLMFANSNNAIPLAGLQALLMCFIIGLYSFYPELELFQEKLIYGI